MIFAGLDIGTSAAKFSIYRDDGLVLAEASEGYPQSAERNRRSANVIWAAAITVMRTALSRLPDVCQVTAMAVSAFGETVVPLGTDGSVLDDSFIGGSFDGDDELQEIASVIPFPVIRNITGLMPQPRFPLVKLRWYKKRPSHFGQISRFAMIEDFIIYRLTGKLAISDSSAARTMAYDRKNRCWSQVLLDAAEVRVDALSEILPSGSCVGRVTADVRDQVGFSNDVHVFTGGHDQLCNAVGAGVLDDGTILNCSGTVECISGVFPLTKAEAAMNTLPLQLGPFADDPNSCLTFWAPIAGCASLDWFIRFLNGNTRLSGRELLEKHIAMEGCCSKTPTRLLLAPYFTGRNHPDFSSACKSVILGMDLYTEPWEVYQSIMEGIAFEMRICLEKFRTIRASPVLLQGNCMQNREGKLIVVGGGSHSQYWVQMKANITGLAVERLQHAQAGTMGCMLMAAAGSGHYNSLSEAAAACVRTDGSFQPEEPYRAMFDDKYQRYLAFRNKMIAE